MPLAEAATIAGLIGFTIARVQECIAGLQMISDARNFDTVSARLRTRLELAKSDLMDWKTSFEQAKDDEMSPMRALDWSNICDALAQLEDLLSNARRLQDRYHFILVPEDQLKAGSQAVEMQASSSPIMRRLDRLRPNLKLVGSQILKQSASTWTKARWGVSDKTRMLDLIVEIEKHIEAITKLTRSRQIAYLVSGTQRLISELFVSSTSQAEVEDVNATIQRDDTPSVDEGPPAQPQVSLGALRAHRLNMRYDQTLQELQSNPDTSPNMVKLSTGVRRKRSEVQQVQSINSDRALATYRDTKVLLEYKRISPGLEDKLKHRVAGLAVLLSKSDTNMLHTLSCEGYYDDIGRNRYVLIYRIPESNNHTQPVEVARVRSLLEQISDTQCPRPSLQARIEMALKMAEAVRNLHVVGWLHKAIRSENVLLVTRPGHDQQQYDTLGPYLAGFGFARAANPTEFSEPPHAQPELNFYCHDALIGPTNRSFRKIFDVYALGILLLEIGLWKPCRDIYIDALRSTGVELRGAVNVSSETRRQMFEQDGSIMRLLADSCPQAFCEAVETCVRPRPEDQWDELECTVQSQSDVVSKLLSLQP